MIGTFNLLNLIVVEKRQKVLPQAFLHYFVSARESEHLITGQPLITYRAHNLCTFISILSINVQQSVAKMILVIR